MVKTVVASQGEIEKGKKADKITDFSENKRLLKLNVRKLLKHV